jgi:hypothetical protein
MVMQDRVRLKYLTRSFRDQLESSGYQVMPDGYGNPSVHFNPEDEESLSSVLIWLAENGAALQADPKDIASPAALVYQLRENGAFEGPYRVCSFDGFKWTYIDK